MATVSMVYAKALYEASGEAKAPVADVAKNLKDVVEIWSGSASLRAVMSGAGGASPQKRADILEDVLAAMKIEGTLKRFLLQLCAKGRLSALPAISTDFESLVSAASGILLGEVKSAVALSADEVSFLAAALEKRIGSKVKLRAAVDPTLLGGVVATVAGKTFDGSLKSQINRFKSELI